MEEVRPAGVQDDPGPDDADHANPFQPAKALPRSPQKPPGATDSGALMKPSTLDRFFLRNRVGSTSDIASPVAEPMIHDSDQMETEGSDNEEIGRETLPGGKRRGDPMGLHRSTSLNDGVCDKRFRHQEDPFARLLKEVGRLEGLTKAHPKTKKEIKDGISNLRLLVLLAKNAPGLRTASPTQEGENATLSDGSSQTPRDIATVHIADLINREKSNPGKRNEIMRMDWPKDAFECTKLVRGGLMRTDATLVRVIVCKPGVVSTNPALSRLGQVLPSLSALSETSLPPNKLATIRCGGAVEIDGVTKVDNSRCLIVGHPPSLEETQLTDFLTTVGAEVRRAGLAKAVLSLPSEISSTRGRMMTEIAFNHQGITVDIIEDKRARAQHNKSAPTRKTGLATSAINIAPTAGMSLADIVKGLKAEVNPEAMGVKVHRMEQTRSGVRIVYHEGNNEGNEFFKKVQSVVGNEARCQPRLRSVIVSDVEAGVNEDTIIQILAKELETSTDNMRPGKISTNQRGSTLVITMPQDLAAKAIALKTIRQNWTRARIREKVDPDFCSSCQSYGHRLCNKAPVGRRCFNCGTLGHIRTECKNAMACHACGVEGHRANAMSCPIFRRLVNDKRSRC